MGLVEERQALMNGVLAAPDRDAPRLVFADWLEEHGEADRAEFIRVQCELARSSDRSDLADRARELLRATPAGAPESVRNDWEWAEEIRLCAIRWVWRRGFVEEIGLFTNLFMDRAGALFRCAPIRAVTLVDREPMQESRPARGNRPARVESVWLRTAGVSREPAGVPALLFRRLRGFRSRTPERAHYRSEADAGAALSAACVAFGLEDAARG